MSKKANLVKMMMMLCEKRMNARELMEELEVSERQIREYKQDLEWAGVDIVTKRGSQGYYAIENTEIIKKSKLLKRKINQGGQGE